MLELFWPSMNIYALSLLGYTTIMEDIHHIMIGIIVCIAPIFENRVNMQNIFKQIFAFEKNIFLDGDYELTYVYDILFGGISFFTVKIN